MATAMVMAAAAATEARGCDQSWASWYFLFSFLYCLFIYITLMSTLGYLIYEITAWDKQGFEMQRASRTLRHIFVFPFYIFLTTLTVLRLRTIVNSQQSFPVVKRLVEPC